MKHRRRTAHGEWVFALQGLVFLVAAMLAWRIRAPAPGRIAIPSFSHPPTSAGLTAGNPQRQAT